VIDLPIGDMMCSRCYTVYGAEEFLGLMFETSGNCRQCGKMFHADRFHLRDEVAVEDRIVSVSTVCLEMAHTCYHRGCEDGEDAFYETMLSDESRVDYDYQWRYHTEEDAWDGHRRAIEMIRDGRIESRRIVPKKQKVEKEVEEEYYEVGYGLRVLYFREDE